MSTTGSVDPRKTCVAALQPPMPVLQKHQISLATTAAFNENTMSSLVLGLRQRRPLLVEKTPQPVIWIDIDF